MESFPISVAFIYFVTFSQQLSKASCLIAEAFYSLGAGACKKAAEQPFLQNVSSGLPPACKPKLQQAGVYYLVLLGPLEKKGWLLTALTNN